MTNEVVFDSEQAEKSEELFKSKYNHVKINKECTYYFEVIYHENKIVVGSDATLLCC